MTRNIVQIVADDLGFGDLGHFNGGVTHTPNIDRLFQKGATFTNAFSASAVCAPARAALLTGRYPHRTGAIDTLEGRGLDRIALRERTAADAFGAAEYRTGLIGKWHNGALDPRFSPTARGFEHFIGFQGGWLDYWEWTISDNGASRTKDGRYLTDVWAEAASSFVADQDPRPFYLMLAFNAPHFPLQAHEADLASVRSRVNVTTEVATIYAMVEAMDRAVGDVLAALEASGRLSDTLVLFTSDNGPHLGGASARPNLNLRDFKGTVYEGGIHVPFAAYCPGTIAEGQAIDSTLHFVDVLPTMLESTGVELAEGAQHVDGRSVWKTLAAAQVENPVRCWQWNRYSPVHNCNAAIREGRWKLVLPPIPEAMVVTPEDLEMDGDLKYRPGMHTTIRLGEPARSVPTDNEAELYDMEVDPGETTDLAGQHPKIVARLLLQLRGWFDSVEADRAIGLQSNL
ncbi:sulfatase-like hydrolase/transferase, partial [Flavobacterium sp.]|uniref:sulfatase-like hydrolase/transferase n=1 Tax=Flavobacterium sp. TaxID=239 RepID=UPI003C41B2D6